MSLYMFYWSNDFHGCPQIVKYRLVSLSFTWICFLTWNLNNDQTSLTNISYGYFIIYGLLIYLDILNEPNPEKWSLSHVLNFWLLIESSNTENLPNQNTTCLRSLGKIFIKLTGTIFYYSWKCRRVIDMSQKSTHP